MNAALAVGDGQGVGSGQCLKAVNLLNRVFCPSQGTAATTGHRAAVGQTRSRSPPLPSPLWPPGKGLGELEATAL